MAELLGYCMLGAQGFTEANDAGLTQAVEARLTAALEAGDSVDAQIVLLTLHAGVIRASVVERYESGGGLSSFADMLLEGFVTEYLARDSRGSIQRAPTPFSSFRPQTPFRPLLRTPFTFLFLFCLTG